MSVENNPIEWVRIAELDLSSAHHLFKTHHPNPLEIVCFHSQQAAEKVLKCFLVMQNIDFPKTHDLNELWKMCLSVKEQ